MADGSDVQAAVDRLAAHLKQSVLVEDRDQRPVWWSTHGAVDATRVRTILDRQVDPQAAAVVARYGLTRATAPVRTPALPGAGMWARWCMPVRREGRLLGLLWVLDPDGTIGETDLPEIVACADLAGEVMVRTVRTAEHLVRLRHELIDRLLRAPDEDVARELARAERIPHDALVQVDAPSRRGGWALPEDMSAHVVMSRTRTATSGAPLPLVELGEAVRRAAATRRAVVAGARPDPPSWDGLGAWRLVVDAPASLTVAAIHPGAEILAAQPRSDLVDTARVVLDNGGDITAAAQVLHVHRTTLYYRLDRITSLTGVDLRTGHGRTDLQLALWLAAYRGTGG
jgi:hypothetical protein